ncbi:MAG: TMEM175 family protein [Acidimicrobiales bacterium]
MAGEDEDANDAAADATDGVGAPGAPAASDGSSGRRPRFPRDTVEFNRIINLSDGVAAIALTLLVLTLDVPTPSGPTKSADMGALLDGLGTPIFAFCLSFVIIASSWYGHHRFVASLRGLDAAMVTWNFAYLFCLVVVPFASDLVGTYGDNPSAVAIYAAIMASLYLVGVPGYELARARGLLAEDKARDELIWTRVSQVIPGLCFLASVPLVMVTQETRVGYWTWVAIWPLSTFAEHRRRRIATGEGGSGDAAKHHAGF